MYIQFVIELKGDGKYSFGDQKDVVVEVDAGDAMTNLVSTFKSTGFGESKNLAVLIFGRVAQKSLENKTLRVSIHYGYRYVEDKAILDIAWFTMWNAVKTLITQTLAITDTYDQSLSSKIRSVRLQKVKQQSRVIRAIDMDCTEEEGRLVL